MPCCPHTHCPPACALLWPRPSIRCALAPSHPASPLGQSSRRTGRHWYSTSKARHGSKAAAAARQGAACPCPANRDPAGQLLHLIRPARNIEGRGGRRSTWKTRSNLASAHRRWAESRQQARRSTSASSYRHSRTSLPRLPRQPASPRSPLPPAPMQHPSPSSLAGTVLQRRAI
jgi:hypothetical protein